MKVLTSFCLLIVFIRICICSDTVLNILERIKNQTQFHIFNLVSSRDSTLSNQLIKGLENSASGSVISFIDPDVSGSGTPSTLLAKLGGKFLTVAVLDDSGHINRYKILMGTLRILERIRDAKVMFVLAETISLEEIQGLVRKCFDVGLLNVIIIRNADPLQVFRFDPFDGFRMIEIGNSEKYFSSKMANLNGYTMKILWLGFPPRVLHPKKGRDKTKVKGYVGHLVRSYIQKRNATVHIIEAKSMSPYLDTANYVENGQMDFVLGLFPTKYKVGVLSYPVTQEKICIIVPEPKTIPVYQNFLLPFQQEVWMVIIGSIIYVTFIIYIVTATMNRGKDIAAAFISTICIIVNRSEAVLLYSLQRRTPTMYFLLLLFGFILSNLYCIRLTTFLTKPAIEREIKSLDDIAQAHMKILLEELEARDMVTEQVNNEYYQSLVEPTSFRDLVKIQFDLNNTNAIVLCGDFWDYLDDFQRYKGSIKFRNSQICFNDVALSIIFGYNSPFVEDFNDHLMQISQSGLLAYWKRNWIFESVQEGYINATKQNESQYYPVQLTLTHLQIPFYGLLIGLVTSIAIFLVEIFCSRFNLLFGCDQC